MTRPGEYVAAALRGLRSTALAGNAAELACGECCAEVTRVASVSVGDEEAASDDPPEDVRVLALAADFPDIRKGCAAILDGDLRLVTSVRVDAAGATLTVGLSDALGGRSAVYRGSGAETVGLSGVRKGGARAATSFPAYVFREADEAPLADSDVSTSVRGVSAIAPMEGLGGFVPQVGDELTISSDGSRWLVRRVERTLGNWRISARSVEAK